MAHMDVPEMENQDGGPTHLDLPSQGHSLCQSALVVRLEDFRLGLQMTSTEVILFITDREI